MQRTYRYNAQTGAMLPVMQGHKQSRRRRTPAAQQPAAAPAAGVVQSNRLYPAGAIDAGNGYDESAYPVVRLDGPDAVGVPHQA